MLPELSFSDRWSRGTKLWERDWRLCRIRLSPPSCFFSPSTTENLEQANSLDAVGYTDNGRTDGLDLGESSEEHGLAARHSLLNANVVSRQPDSKSVGALTDLELSCLLYCRLSLVVHRS